MYYSLNILTGIPPLLHATLSKKFDKCNVQTSPAPALTSPLHFSHTPATRAATPHCNIYLPTGRSRTPHICLPHRSDIHLSHLDCCVHTSPQSRRHLISSGLSCAAALYSYVSAPALTPPLHFSYTPCHPRGHASPQHIPACRPLAHTAHMSASCSAFLPTGHAAHTPPIHAARARHTHSSYAATHTCHPLTAVCTHRSDCADVSVSSCAIHFSIPNHGITPAIHSSSHTNQSKPYRQQ